MVCLVARPRNQDRLITVPAGRRDSRLLVLFLLMLYYCRHTTAYLLVLALMFKIMADQIVDFACVGDLDNKCCVTGPLSVEYRSSHLNDARWIRSMGIMKGLFLLISQIVAGVY